MRRVETQAQGAKASIQRRSRYAKAKQLMVGHILGDKTTAGLMDALKK